MDELEDQQKEVVINNSRWPVAIAIFFGTWIIGMCIIVAGLMISKELAKNNAPQNISNIPPQKTDIAVPAGIPVLGNNNAPVTIIEFADFQCPFCEEWQKSVFPDLKKNYIDTGKARFVFMNYAFLGEESVKAAEAARCAQDQNKFWEYHDKLYELQKGENQGTFSDANLKNFANLTGLESGSFNKCFDSRTYQKEIEANVTQASQYGVQSTPTVFINGLKYEGVYPYQTYADTIEMLLKK